MQSLLDNIVEVVAETLGQGDPEAELSFRQRLQRIFQEESVAVIRGKPVDLRKIPPAGESAGKSILQALGISKNEWKRLSEKEREEIVERIQDDINKWAKMLILRFYGEEVLTRLKEQANLGWEAAPPFFVVRNAQGEYFNIQISGERFNEIVMMDTTLSLQVVETLPPWFNIAIYQFSPQNFSYEQRQRATYRMDNVQNAIKMGAKDIELIAGKGDGVPPSGGIALFILLAHHWRERLRRFMVNVAAILHISEEDLSPAEVNYALTHIPASALNTRDYTMRRDESGNMYLVFKVNVAVRGGIYDFLERLPQGEPSYTIDVVATIRAHEQAQGAVEVSATIRGKLHEALPAPHPLRDLAVSNTKVIKVVNWETAQVVNVVLSEMEKLLLDAAEKFKKNFPAGALMVLRMAYIDSSWFPTLVDELVKDDAARLLSTYLAESGIPLKVKVAPLWLSTLGGNLSVIVSVNITKNKWEEYVIDFSVDFGDVRIFVTHNAVAVVMPISAITLSGGKKTEMEEKLIRRTEGIPFALNYTLRNDEVSNPYRHEVNEALAEGVAKVLLQAIQWLLDTGGWDVVKEKLQQFLAGG